VREAAGDGVSESARDDRQRPARPSAIARSLLLRQAGEVLLPETPDAAEPALSAALLDTLCDLLGVEGEA
jgi:hypothetical protein